MRLSKRAALFLIRRHRALAFLRAAQAAPDLLHALGVRLVEGDEVGLKGIKKGRVRLIFLSRIPLRSASTNGFSVYLCEDPLPELFF